MGKRSAEMHASNRNATLRCTPEQMSGTLPMATPRSYQIPHSHAVWAYNEFHDPIQRVC